jgi:hypothetical protein
MSPDSGVDDRFLSPESGDIEPMLLDFDTSKILVMVDYLK